MSENTPEIVAENTPESVPESEWSIKVGADPAKKLKIKIQGDLTRFTISDPRRPGSESFTDLDEEGRQMLINFLENKT
jgi:hypothetical protein